MTVKPKKLDEGIMAKRKDNPFAIILGALTLGGVCLKALFNRNTMIYRCPECDLVLRANSSVCPRCHTELEIERR